MKKLLFTLALVAVATLADAQGTIHLANGAGTRFSINGVIPPATGGPIGGAYNFGVFAGLTADSLALQPVLWTNMSVGGLINGPPGQEYPIPGFEPDSRLFIQIRGRESTFGTDWERARAEGLFGQTDIKPFVLGPSPGPGTVVWSETDATKFQHIDLVPEPSTIALVGLGFGSLVLFRGRKRSSSD